MNRLMRKLVVTTVIMLLAAIVMPGTGTEAKAAGKYRIRINKQQNCVTVYRYEDGKYKPYKAMPCSAGWDTPLGNFSLKEKIRWHELDGPVYGQYCTRITGHILFHSVWYYQKDNPATLSNTQYNKLGTTASHGCVRLCVGDSKWIYDNCPSGTPVNIYSSKDPGPLGKPDAIKLPSGWGWDPTDVTNPSNPYNKKKPVIALKSGKKKLINIPFASEFDPMDTVTAKNTTGFDSIKLVNCKIRFKEKGVKRLRRVKRINTRRAGDYRVKFYMTDEIGRKAELNVTYRVNTKIKMKSMTLNYSKRTLYLGGSKSEASVKLKLKKYRPAKASITSLRYTSENNNIATVDQNGNVRAVTPGITTIWASSRDGSRLRKSCVIVVRRYADSVTFIAQKADITVGENTGTIAAVNPADATGGDNITYTYTSSDNNIAVVNESGQVTGVAPGTVVITVTVNNAAANGAALKAQTIINVIPALDSQDVTTSALGVQ